MRRAGAISNDVVIQEIAEDLLRKGRSATASALGAFFMVAAEQATTLFSPLILLVAGTGRGVKVFDGRVRQPGLGRKRPRGFLPAEAIPEASRVGVPMSIAAAGVAMAFDGSVGLSQVVRPAATRARELGFPARAQVMEGIATLGPRAVSDTLISQSFLRSAGPSVGGLITPSDLRQIPPTAFSAQTFETPEGMWSHPLAEAAGFPLDAKGREHAAAHLGAPKILLTADPEGVLACVCFFQGTAGIPLEGLDLSAPALALPVERGVARVPAGAALYSPAPLAVLTNPQGAYTSCVGLVDVDTPTPVTVGAARLRLRRELATLAVY